jgi:hypothetical protein
MKEQEFYETILDIIKPWKVERVELDKSNSEEPSISKTFGKGKGNMS